jgi:putative CocE/NonD family hydrolase
MLKIVCIVGILLSALFQSTLSAQSGQLVRNSYQKMEYKVPMRDGVRLHTAVYIPKDASPTQKYPILLLRTCYGVAPYGADVYPEQVGPSAQLMREKYIFVYQDVRGRWASEGDFTNMTPTTSDQKPLVAVGNPPKGKLDVRQRTLAIDESSDTYDTIDWLLKNIPNNNSRVGQWGISYPGFYTIAGAIAAHPALKAASPQAPVSDPFFEDFHHNGAFVQMALFAYPLFGVQRPQPTTKAWFADQFIDAGTQDSFRWHYELGPLNNANQYYKANFFWKETVEHPNYDEFWQKRSIIPHLKNIKPALMTVGGWFDAEDLYGPLTIYKTVEKNNPGIYNTLVMGPFGHREWSNETGHSLHGDIYFGDSIATFYQRNIEARFFDHFLKGPGDGKTGLPEAYLFDTGKKEWRTFDQWPAAAVQTRPVYLTTEHKLASQGGSGNKYVAFVSDPLSPVPFSEEKTTVDDFTPLNKYMSADQRFASRRADVLTYQTEVLTEDLTLGGVINAKLKVSTSGTDADWVVKLIDVYPPNEPGHPYLANPTKTLGNYQQMVRSEVMRGRFRHSFEKPEPFKAGEITDVNFQLQDILHTFKKGHRLMIQVQSSWFPLIDRNPQKYVENIYKAKSADFSKAIHRVYDNSVIELPVLK